MKKEPLPQNEGVTAFQMIAPVVGALVLLLFPFVAYGDMFTAEEPIIGLFTILYYFALLSITYILSITNNFQNIK
jgi:hypothetical protein